MNADDNLEFKRLLERVAALESRDVMNVFRDDHDQPNPVPQPQYREPTIEDARELANDKGRYFCMGDIADRLKQLGFVRKVQP